MQEERIVPLRLQKFLARAGVASRRGSEDLMTAGRVTVNGEVACELGTKVDPRVDEVRVDGRIVTWGEGPVTILPHKPAGFITTMHDQANRPCVADLVPTDRYPGLFPIGRLDRDTTGALLFSTDGDLGNRLLHPRYHVSKRYIVLIEGELSLRDLDALRSGVRLEDGITQPASVEVLDDPRDVRRRFGLVLRSETSLDAQTRRRYRREEAEFPYAAVSIEIHEGRYHQVKRMFEAVGHPVVALHREYFGPISVGSLERSSWRILEEEEVASLAPSSLNGGE